MGGGVNLSGLKLLSLYHALSVMVRVGRGGRRHRRVSLRELSTTQVVFLDFFNYHCYAGAEPTKHHYL